MCFTGCFDSDSAVQYFYFEIFNVSGYLVINCTIMRPQNSTTETSCVNIPDFGVYVVNGFSSTKETVSDHFTYNLHINKTITEPSIIGKPF